MRVKSELPEEPRPLTQGEWDQLLTEEMWRQAEFQEKKVDEQD